MPELNDDDAIRMAVQYYKKERGFALNDAVRLVEILAKAGIIGLIQFAFNAGARDAKGESQQ
mgnify:CR=1 FL=1